MGQPMGERQFDGDLHHAVSGAIGCIAILCGNCVLYRHPHRF